MKGREHCAAIALNLARWLLACRSGVMNQPSSCFFSYYPISNNFALSLLSLSLLPSLHSQVDQHPILPFLSIKPLSALAEILPLLIPTPSSSSARSKAVVLRITLITKRLVATLQLLPCSLM
jgi:hypothetical protein